VAVGFIEGYGRVNMSDDWANEEGEEIIVVGTPFQFNHLGIFCLDGSGCMNSTGDGGITLAESVNYAVKEFLGFFKCSRNAGAYSIAIITFSDQAKVHTKTKSLIDIDDFANYNPLNGHGGGTNIGEALNLAGEIAEQFLLEQSEVPRSVSIVVMSDGECGSPDSTKQIADRLKQNDKIRICSVLITAKGSIGSERATNTLQYIASDPRLFKTTYSESDLRKFFIFS